MLLKRLFSVLFLLLVLSFVSPSKNGATAKTYTEGTLTGIASYYAAKFEGRLTATGEVFKQRLMTAASNLYKLNTWVRVTNLRNGKSVIVRVNDRMHPNMVKIGRVIDLTNTAAAQIGLTKGYGLTKVRVERVPIGTQS